MARSTNLGEARNACLLYRSMAVLLLVSVSASFAAEEEEKLAKTSDELNRPFGKLELHRETVIDGAARLTEVSDIGLSVEVPLASSLNAPPPRLEELSATLDGGRVRDLLDGLCELDRSMAWSADGDMVNLFPRKTVSDSSYLFNRRVSILRFSQVRDAGEAVLQAVAQLPGKKEQIAHMQVGGSTAFPKPWSATFTNITIREALNRIARQLGPTYGWKVQGSQDFRWIMFHQRLHPRPSQAELK